MKYRVTIERIDDSPDAKIDRSQVSVSDSDLSVALADAIWAQRSPRPDELLCNVIRLLDPSKR